MPYELFTVDPAVQSLADLSDKNKIGLPAIKVSIPAIFLQMAAARLYGAENYQKLDALTVSFRRTEYAVGATQKEMRARGLPEALAARLALGV